MISNVKKLGLSAVMASLLVSVMAKADVIETLDTVYLGSILDERFAREQLTKTLSDSDRKNFITLQEAAIQHLASSVKSDQTFMIGFKDSVDGVTDDLMPRGKQFISSLKILIENAKSAYPEFSSVFSKLASDLDEKAVSDEKFASEGASNQGLLSKAQLELETISIRSDLDQYVEGLKTLNGVAELFGALLKVQAWIDDVGSRTTESWYDGTSVTDIKSRIRGKLLAGEKLYSFGFSDKLLSRDTLTSRLNYVFEILRKKFRSQADKDMVAIREEIRKNIKTLKRYYSAKDVILNRLKAAKELKNWIKINDTLENVSSNTQSLSLEARWDCYNLINTVSSFFSSDFFKDSRNVEMNREILLSRVDELIKSLEDALKEVQPEKNKKSSSAIQEEDASVEAKLKENIKNRSSWNVKIKTQERIEAFKELQKWIDGKKANVWLLSSDAYWVFSDIRGFFGDILYINTYEGVSWSVLEKRVKKGLALEQEYLKNIGSQSGSGSSGRGGSKSYSSSYATDYKKEWYSKSLKEQRTEIENQKSAMEKSDYQKRNFRKTNPYAPFVYKLLLTDLKQDGITDENAFDKCKALGSTGIKKEYRKWSLKLHPDKNGGDAVKTEQFKYLTAAYENLNLLLEFEPFE